MADHNAIAFAFDERAVRIFPTNTGSFDVVAKDVADVLGYRWNGSQVIAHVPEEWRGVRSVLTLQGNQELLTLTEEGLYFFLSRSDKPKARPFQKWLAGEVLPSIRKNGFYGKGPSISQQLAAHGVRLRLTKELKVETDPAVRLALHQQLDHVSRLIGIETPALEAIGRSERPASESPLITDFWEAIALLIGETDEHKLNHARSTGLLAINLLQVERAAKAARLSMPRLDELRRVLRHSQSPRFVELKAVNSRHGGTVKCWVFEREEGEEV